MRSKSKALILMGLVVVGSGAVVVFSKRNDQNGQTDQTTDQTETAEIVFSHHITDLENISFVQPPGGIEGWEGEKVLKPHAYVITPERAPVYAPIDSELYQGTNYIEEGIEQYSVFFKIGDHIRYYFDHILEPSEKVEAAFPGSPRIDTRSQRLRKPIHFGGGELVGYADGRRGTIHFDFGVYDIRVKHNLEDLEAMPGMNLAERDYQAVCPFDFYSKEMQAEYYKLFDTIRTQDQIPDRFCN